ncbi:Scr1 family TA system antitoxin-like transcriptional regulator [Umezawaea sp. Da 62-37]|uniref:Scr1 family TA system antitoxin-like transcriptional regulator n=1 Tax=Umezawaea sp. Da 62-37 TaxID=3075927 RepID=UPI0028F7331A|nr:Scr1 family TA system antitoxin-like transcriptional regulator [Umezawaea sp. Da 62-37]WNV92094.1 Scr1 family TA system antitoxin-like transcriptional regulator [Umezawaea sp. Da 62-37]
MLDGGVEHRSPGSGGVAEDVAAVRPGSASQWRMESADLMCDQIEHLSQTMCRTTVRLGVVPWSADTNLVALQGFQVYDERVVTISVLTGNATITDPYDVREYVALVDRRERLVQAQPGTRVAEQSVGAAATSRVGRMGGGVQSRLPHGERVTSVPPPSVEDVQVPDGVVAAEGGGALSG